MTLEELAQSTATSEVPVSESELCRVEHRLGVPIPGDYRRFLSMCNGAFLDARFAAFGVFPDRLFGVSDDDEQLSLWTVMDYHAELMKDGKLPIGNEHSGEVICIQVRGEDTGTVWCGSVGEMRRVAESFAVFVESLVFAEHMSPDAILYEDGVIHVESDRFTEALVCFQRSFAIREHASTAHRLGDTLLRLGRQGESGAWFAHAYQLNPRSNMISTAYARSLHEQGRDQEARTVLHSVLSNTPTYGPARRLLAALQA